MNCEEVARIKEASKRIEVVIRRIEEAATKWMEEAARRYDEIKEEVVRENVGNESVRPKISLHSFSKEL
jgi:hypothetical protein